MRHRWARREIDAPAGVVWELLVDTAAWPHWGPSVVDASVDGGRLEPGATGTVRTVLGIRLPFEITAFEPGTRWAWKVAGIPATEHVVEPLGRGRCRLSFGVPTLAAPYLAVCGIALRRLDTLATEPAGGTQEAS